MFGAVAHPHRFCLVHLRTRRPIKLHAAYHEGEGPLAAQSEALDVFSTSLIRFALAENPALLIRLGMPRLLWWSWFLTFGLLTLAIAILIVFGSIGLIEVHQFGWSTAGFMVLLAVIGAPPALFLRGTWRRRSQSVAKFSNDLWQRADRG